MAGIQLKNRDKLPKVDYDTVSVLGLEIPLTDSLPFGGQVELFDLQSAKDAGDVGNFEFMLRLFCIFTRRLPKPDHVRYEWLAQQTLEAEEMTEIVTAVNALIGALNAGKEPGEGKAKGKRAS